MKNNLHALLFLALGACANVAMPTGGPRDKKPPELLSSTPENNQLNFTGRTIELTFNEDIKLKDPKEEILIVPNLGKNTLFTVKKKKLVIEPQLPWQENTTYNINFRDGVQDLTEGNPSENLRIAFSTGPTIDSLSITGNIKEVFTEKIPEKITIALYQSDTFDIFKHTPTYFTKSSKTGKFSIPNLKSSTYYIYAFDDKNKNLKVDSKTEKFGFLSKPINLNQSLDSVEVPVTMIDSRPLVLTNIRHTDKISRIKFNKQIDSLSITGIPNNKSIYSFTEDKSELIFYNALEKGDSIKTHLYAQDSLGQKIDTVIFIKTGEIKSAQEKLKTKEIGLSYDLTTKSASYSISYNKPIGALNIDSIYIRYDSVKTEVLDKKDVVIDTLNHQIKLKALIHNLSQDEKGKVEQPKFILGKGAIITIENDSLKQITKPIATKKEEDLGTIFVNVETKAKNFIIQIITTDNKVVRSIPNKKENVFKYLEPSEYKIRAIIDENNNGKWDPANFWQKKEAEKIILYKSEDGKYSTQLRAYFEIGPLLIKF